MTFQAVQFPFTVPDPALGPIGLQPYLPIVLARDSVLQKANGLLDTGATVNVLPYSVGLQLGAKWDDQTVPCRLTGSLAQVEARGLLLDATVANFPVVRLAFAWVRTDEVRLLLGQVNFFQEFDVCFFRSRKLFEVKPR